MSDAPPAESAPEAPVSEPQTETTSLPEPENAEPPAPEAEPEAPFEPKVGDLVEAKWKGGKEWFPAKITAWYPPKTKARDPHYDVEHEDGATQEQLRVDEIRALAPAVAADVAFRPPAPTYFLEGSPRPKGRARRVAVRLNGAIVDAATLPAPPRPSPTSPSPRKRRRAAADPLDVLADFLAARGGDPARLEGFEAKHVDVTEHVTRVEYVGPDGATYKSRAQVARALVADLGDDWVDIFWDGGSGGWYPAQVVSRKPNGGKAKVEYSDGRVEWLLLAAAPHGGDAKPEPSKLAAWRPTGVTAGDDGALLDFEP